MGFNSCNGLINSHMSVHCCLLINSEYECLLSVALYLCRFCIQTARFMWSILNLETSESLDLTDTGSSHRFTSHTPHGQVSIIHTHIWTLSSPSTFNRGVKNKRFSYTDTQLNWNSAQNSEKKIHTTVKKTDPVATVSALYQSHTCFKCQHEQPVLLLNGSLLGSNQSCLNYTIMNRILSII